MNEHEKAKEWLKRAKSNLTLAQLGKVNDFVLYEDLCFNAQQAVEKGLKALCIYFGQAFPKTHDISYLISLIENNKILIPQYANESKILTDYSVETRYPAEFEPVTEDEYKKAIELAEQTLTWIESIINK